MSNERKHISVTHNERYFHIEVEGSHVSRATVFFRQSTPRAESPQKFAGWEASIALCDERDQFSRTVGRSVARRKFFSKNYMRKQIVGEPTYEKALALVEEAASKRDFYVENAVA